MQNYKGNEIMYIPQNLLNGDLGSIWCDTENYAIPNDPQNRHYQLMLDRIIEEGADCFKGDIPDELQKAADEKKTQTKYV